MQLFYFGLDAAISILKDLYALQCNATSKKNR